MKKAAAEVESSLQSKANLMASWFENSACKCLSKDGNVKSLDKASMIKKAKCKSKELLAKAAEALKDEI